MHLPRREGGVAPAPLLRSPRQLDALLCVLPVRRAQGDREMPRLPRRDVQHPCELRCFVHAHPLAARAHRSGRACKAREGALHLLHATRSRPTRALRRWSRRICACHGRSVWLLWTLTKLQKKTPKRKLHSRWPLVTTHSTRRTQPHTHSLVSAVSRRHSSVACRVCLVSRDETWVTENETELGRPGTGTC